MEQNLYIRKQILWGMVLLCANTFCFAEEISSRQDGDWNHPATWGVASIPSIIDRANVYNEVTISAGTQVMTGWPSIESGTLSIYGSLSTNNSSGTQRPGIGIGSGTIHLYSGGIIEKTGTNSSGQSAANLVVGSGDNAVGYFYNDGGRITNNGDYGMVLGYDNHSQGYYIQTAGSLTSAHSIHLGGEPQGDRIGSYGEMQISGGTLTAPTLRLGNVHNGAGVLELSGEAVVNSHLYVGSRFNWGENFDPHVRSSGKVFLSGNAKVNGALYAGYSANSVSEIYLSEDAVLGKSSLFSEDHANYWQYLGYSGIGKMTMTGGTWQGYVIALGYEADSSAYLKMEGGKIQATYMTMGENGNAEIRMKSGEIIISSQPSSELRLGAYSATTTFYATGGKIETLDLLIGLAKNETNITGGTGVLYLSGNASLQVNDELYLGDTVSRGGKGFLALMNGGNGVWNTSQLRFQDGGKIAFMPGGEGLNTLQIANSTSISANKLLMGVANGFNTLPDREATYTLLKVADGQTLTVASDAFSSQGIFNTTVNGNIITAELNPTMGWENNFGSYIRQAGKGSDTAGYLQWNPANNCLIMSFANDAETVSGLADWLNAFEDGTEVTALGNTLSWILPTEEALWAWDFGFYNRLNNTHLSVSSVTGTYVPEPCSGLLLLLTVVGYWSFRGWKKSLAVKV